MRDKTKRKANETTVRFSLQKIRRNFFFYFFCSYFIGVLLFIYLYICLLICYLFCLSPD